MLRHGYIKSPITWREFDLKDSHCLWIIIDPYEEPDIIIFYCHGGGFSMGSCYFYLEFLLAWLSLLKEAGYRNPAIFCLEYSLVPDAVYPTQLEQTITGYEYVCKKVRDPSRICVGGDSAGATLILSLLLHLAERPNCENQRPGYAALISPWTALFSTRNRNTASDFLDANQLHKYGRQYAGSEENLYNPLSSPGVCRDGIWWAKASPSKGYLILFGSEEVFGPEIREFVALQRKNGCAVSVKEESGSIHCWPVAQMFLCGTQAERQKGLEDLVKMVKRAIEIQ